MVSGIRPSGDVDSVAVMQLAREIGVQYVDTVVEPWPGYYFGDMPNAERTGYRLRERVREARKAHAGGPTAVSCCGANPGMVSWLVKEALLRLAADLGGQALFPFGGPPFTPFHHLALRSGQAFAAPIRFLVHARMGLWASYRGAIALPGTHGLPPPAANPCTDCAAPCLRSCPVAALSREGYDTAACHAHLDRDGENCLSSGCLARRACPAGKSYGRLPEQSSWHMRQFHP